MIGGYLGAGKTSLLNHLLTHAGGERIAVLVNDFGELGLDAALVARRDTETITLTNGCVCCSIADDFGAALDAQVRSPRPPERIVVETSGVADPGKSARYAQGWPGVRLDAVITVVDLETIRTQATDRFVGDLVVRQIASADVLVANKSDRVELPARRVTMDWLARHAPRAGLIDTCHGRVTPAVVLGLDGGEPECLSGRDTRVPRDMPGPDEHEPSPPSERDARALGNVHGLDGHGPGRVAAGSGNGETRGGRSGTQVAPGAETQKPDGLDTHPAAGGDVAMPFVRVSCRTRVPFDRARLAAALDALPSVVVRFKGLVRLQESPDQLLVLQGVGSRWSLEPAPPTALAAAADLEAGAVIDLIGVGPAEPIESAARKIASISQQHE